MLCLGVDLSREVGHAPTLTFFVDFWLRNLSGLPIVPGFVLPKSSRTVPPTVMMAGNRSSSASSFASSSKASSSSTSHAAQGKARGVLLQECRRDMRWDSVALRIELLWRCFAALGTEEWGSS